jgi:PKD repeat protein
MKIKLLLLILTLNKIVFAQISILNADMPRANDTLRYSISTSTLNYAATDTNYTWDFSTLKINNQDIQKYYTPLSTPYVLQFLSATYGIPESNLNLGPVGGGTASDVYSFFKTSASALVVVGRGATIQNLPLGIVYSSKDTIYKYPMIYGKTYSSSYAGEAGLAGVGTLKQSGTRNTIVDGWGKITTPYGTFDCIRIKSTVLGTDSIVFGGFGIPIPANRTEYTWLAKGERFPILEVIVNNTTSLVTSIKMKDRYRPEAYVNNCNFNANRTLIKPADTVTFTNTSFGNPTSFNWQITPGTYRFAAGSSATSEMPKIIFDSLGNYDIKLRVNYLGGSDDTLKIAYIKVRDAVIADFSASTNQPTINETVTFTDKSKGNPSVYLWTITPATNIKYVNGTDMTSSNPQVSFLMVGSYNVQLRVTGPGGTNTVMRTGYINVYATGLSSEEDKLSVSYFPNPAKDVIHFEFTKSLPAKIDLSDFSGKLVLTETLEGSKGSKINVGHLKAGVYFLQITQGSETFMGKLVLTSH